MSLRLDLKGPAERYKECMSVDPAYKIDLKRHYQKLLRDGRISIADYVQGIDHFLFTRDVGRFEYALYIAKRFFEDESDLSRIQNPGIRLYHLYMRHNEPEMALETAERAYLGRKREDRARAKMLIKQQRNREERFSSG